MDSLGAPVSGRAAALSFKSDQHLRISILTYSLTLTLQHTTTPLSNTVLSQTTALTNDVRQFQFGYGQQFITGTNAQLTFWSSRSNVNSPANLLNPATSGYLDLYVTQNLLQGFKVAVNNRNIRVAKNNMKVTDLQLKRQVITTVSAILNVYGDLVEFQRRCAYQGAVAVEGAK